MPKQDTSLDDIAGSIADLATLIDQRFVQVDERFESIDQRFVQVDERFESIDQRFNQQDAELRLIKGQLTTLTHQQHEMREWIGSIDNRLLGVESDIKEIYSQLVALDKIPKDKRTSAQLVEMEQKLAILMGWAKQVSRHNGVPLPKL